MSGQNKLWKQRSFLLFSSGLKVIKHILQTVPAVDAHIHTTRHEFVWFTQLRIDSHIHIHEAETRKGSEVLIAAEKNKQITLSLSLTIMLVSLRVSLVHTRIEIVPYHITGIQVNIL